MKNVQFEKLREIVKGEKYYALLKIYLEDMSAYCIAARDDELCIQSIANDSEKASEIFEQLSCGEVSAMHINDVVRDMQNEIFI